MGITAQQSRSLLDLAVPALNQEQLDLFVYDKLYVTDGGPFDLHSALDRLHQKIGRQVIGIDIGGDKAVTQLFTVSEQGLIADTSFSNYQHDEAGVGYLESLERTAAFAKKHNIPVGLSIGIPLRGSKTADKTKLPALQKALGRYDDDFAVLIPNLTACLNDGFAGLISSTIHVNLLFAGEIDHIIYVINGGGMGSAVLKDGRVYALEAGHTVPVINALNHYDERRECGVFGAKHVCFELVASNKKGIEAIWARKTGRPLNAINIEKQFTQAGEFGDLALGLYDYSALMVAHLIKGLSTAFDLTLSDPAFTFVGHGGAFKFPNYGARIKQILVKDMGGKNVSMLLTNSYINNACLDGAALYAITNS